MATFEDKGYFLITSGVTIKVIFDANIRFVFGLYQDDHLIFSSEANGGNKAEVKPKNRRTVLKWFVIPSENIDWKYTVSILAGGQEVALIENEVLKEECSLQKCAIIIENGGDANDS